MSTPGRGRAARRSRRGRRTAARRRRRSRRRSRTKRAAAGGRSAISDVSHVAQRHRQQPEAHDRRLHPARRLAVGELEPGDRDQHLAHRDQEVDDELPAAPRPSRAAGDRCRPGSARAPTNASAPSTMPSGHPAQRRRLEAEARGGRIEDLARERDQQHHQRRVRGLELLRTHLEAVPQTTGPSSRACRISDEPFWSNSAQNTLTRMKTLVMRRTAIGPSTVVGAEAGARRRPEAAAPDRRSQRAERERARSPGSRRRGARRCRQRNSSAPATMNPADSATITGQGWSARRTGARSPGRTRSSWPRRAGPACRPGCGGTWMKTLRPIQNTTVATTISTPGMPNATRTPSVLPDPAGSAGRRRSCRS